MTSRSVSHIIEARLAQADTGGRKPRKSPGDDLFINSNTLTHVAGYPARNPAEAAEAERADRDEKRRAARSVIRLNMGTHACRDPKCKTPRRGEKPEGVARRHPIGGHGCKGPGCRLPGHGEAVVKAREILEAAGLAPYESGNKVNRAGMGPRPKAAAG